MISMKMPQAIQKNQPTFKVHWGARLAGFNNDKIIAPLIERLYEQYELIGVQLDGYPSLEERQATAKSVTATVEELWNMFRAGNFLSAIGYHEMAAACYEHLLEYYIGREIYNNLAVEYAYAALTFDRSNAYRFPFETDINSRIVLARGEPGGPPQSYNEYALIRDYVDRGQAYVEKALEMDPVYGKAYINQLALLVMANEHHEVIRKFEGDEILGAVQLMGITQKEQEDIQLIVGIAYASLMKSKKASEIFESLLNSQNLQVRTFAAYNLNLLLGKRLPPPFRRNNCENNSLDLSSLPGASLFSYSNKYGKSLSPHQSIKAYWEANGTTVIYAVHQKGKSMVFQRFTNASSSGPFGLGVGASIDQLLARMEDAEYITAPAGASYFIDFPTCRLVFLVDESGIIREWAKYQ